MIANSVIGVAGKILDKFVEDKDLKTKINGELRKQTLALAQEQAKANTEQAKHPSIFVSGARPAIMWVACLGLFTNFFILPLAEWACAIWAPGITLPDLQTEELMSLVIALLGLGGMRSFEKSRGVARDNLKK
tara:strand:- start:194 stop:592 length:399 start_codon:yes stop_codon:yes gene_type:complete